MYRIRGYLADIGSVYERFYLGGSDAVDGTESPDELLGRSLADAGNTEASEHSLRRRTYARTLDGIEELVRVLLETQYLLFDQPVALVLQRVYVRDVLEVSELDELSYILVAESLDVHAVARDEVDYPSRHGRRAGQVDALEVGRISFLNEMVSAHGADIRHDIRLPVRRSLALDDALDLRDDLA